MRLSRYGVAAKTRLQSQAGIGLAADKMRSEPASDMSSPARSRKELVRTHVERQFLRMARVHDRLRDQFLARPAKHKV